MSGYIGRLPLTEAIQTRKSFVATAGQTTFSMAYQAGYIDVYLNGIKIREGASEDYVASNGTSIVLNSGVVVNTELDVVSLTSASIVDKLPTQSSSTNGKILQSDGTNASWATDSNTTYSVGDGGLSEINFTSADHSKLNGIEASADVTDVTNVTAAGALMDSEVTNLAAVKAFATTDYATAAQGTTANAALPKAGGAMTGAITTTSTFDGRDVATDGSKLDLIEASADVTDTANVVAALSAGTGVTISGAGVVAVSAVALTTVQTAVSQAAQLALTAQEGDVVVRSDENKSYVHNGGTAGTMADYTLLATPTDAVLSVNGVTGAVTAAHIAAAVEAASGSNTFTDADHTKLNAIEASADVTDTTNVTAAGALMDSELAGLAAVKATTGTFLTADQTKLDGIATAANNYVHPTTAGNKHVPTAGAAGQFLKYSASGTAVWAADNNTTYSVGDGGLSEINFTSADHSKLNGIATSANNYSHPTTAGNKHIPTAGAAGQFLKYSASGTAVWAADNNTVYSHPTHPGDDFSVDSGVLSGATVISDIDINVTTDTSGHVTDANGTISTRNLTLANLGYTGATNANYITNNNQLTNGAGYITGYTDTNTTYTADGNYGMTLSGTAFRLEDDRRRNSTTTDIYSGNTHDYTFYDASHGIRWYTEGAEEMRLENDGDLHVDGDVIAYSTTVSDERLKTGIAPITDALSKVNQLKGCTFTYKADGRKSAGLIAQDVEKVLPSAVTTSQLVFHGEEGKEYKVLQYDQTIGLLVEAIKELSAKVEALENK